MKPTYVKSPQLLEMPEPRPAETLKMHLETLSYQTRERMELINITADLDEVVRVTGVDYHRVKMHERYDDVLVRFLLGRTPKRSGR